MASSFVWRLKKPSSPTLGEATSWLSGSNTKTLGAEDVHNESAASQLQGSTKQGHTTLHESSSFHHHGALKKNARPHLQPWLNFHERPYLWSSQLLPVPPPTTPTIGAPHGERRLVGSARFDQEDLVPYSQNVSDDRQPAETH
jgi:hypothetical protein